MKKEGYSTCSADVVGAWFLSQLAADLAADFCLLLVPRQNDLHVQISALSTVAEPSMQSRAATSDAEEEGQLAAADVSDSGQDLNPDLHLPEVKH